MPISDGIKRAPLGDYSTRPRLAAEYSLFHESAGASMHRGIDFVGNVNEDVFATHNGEVIAIIDSQINGKVVVIKDDLGMATLYYNVNAENIVVGSQVSESQRIGSLFQSSESIGSQPASLHFEILAEDIVEQISSSMGDVDLVIDLLKSDDYATSRINPRDYMSLPREIQVPARTAEIGSSQFSADSSYGNTFLIRGNVGVKKIKGGSNPDTYSIQFDKSAGGGTVEIEDPNIDGVLTIDGKRIFQGEIAIPMRYENGSIATDSWYLKDYFLERSGPEENDLLLFPQSKPDNKVIIKNFFLEPGRVKFGLYFDTTYSLDAGSSHVIGMPRRFNLANVAVKGDRKGSFLCFDATANSINVQRRDANGNILSRESIRKTNPAISEIRSDNALAQFGNGKIGVFFVEKDISSFHLKAAMLNKDGKLIGSKVLHSSPNPISIVNGHLNDSQDRSYCSFVENGRIFNVNLDQIDQPSVVTPGEPSGVFVTSYSSTTLGNGDVVSSSTLDRISITRSGQASSVVGVSQRNVPSEVDYVFDSQIDFISASKDSDISILPRSNGILYINPKEASLKLNFQNFPGIDSQYFARNARVVSEEDFLLQDFMGKGKQVPSEFGVAFQQRRRDASSETFSEKYAGLPDVDSPDFLGSKFVVLKLPNDQLLIINSDGAGLNLNISVPAISTTTTPYPAVTSTEASIASPEPTITSTTTSYRIDFSSSTSTESPYLSIEATDSSSTASQTSIATTSRPVITASSSSSIIPSTTSEFQAPSPTATSSAVTEGSSTVSTTRSATRSTARSTTQRFVDPTEADTTDSRFPDGIGTSTAISKAITQFIVTTTMSLSKIATTSRPQISSSGIPQISTTESGANDSQASSSNNLYYLAFLALLAVGAIGYAYYKKSKKNKIGVANEVGEDVHDHQNIAHREGEDARPNPVRRGAWGEEISSVDESRELAENVDQPDHQAQDVRVTGGSDVSKVGNLSRPLPPRPTRLPPLSIREGRASVQSPSAERRFGKEPDTTNETSL